MRNFTISLFLTALVCIGTNAQRVDHPKSLRNSIADAALSDLRPEQRANSKKSPRLAKRVPMKSAAAPGNYQLIEPTDGDEEVYVKSGYSYVNSSFFGISTQSCDGAISNVVISEDGKKLFAQTPFFLDYYTEESWIEGDIDGDTVTFTFPQLVDEDIDDEEPEYNVFGYCMKVKFKVEDEAEQSGWYYPTESQEYKFHIEEDGTLTSLEDEDTMMGYCLWIEADEENAEGHFSWQGTGDIVFSMTPNRAEEREVPSDLKYDTWKFINGISSTNVSIAVDDENMYIKGLFNKSGMKDKVVVGKIEGDNVIFDNAQYLGVYWTNYTVAYFVTGEMEDDTFVIKDNATFKWDRENQRIMSDDAICISSSPTTVIWYMLTNKPVFAIPNDNVVVSRLYTPVLTSFYDIDEEYDYDAELSFNLPTVDPDYQILNTSRIYYQVFVDGDLFTFYDDEYGLPKGVSETTMIPYGFYNNKADLDAWGTEHTIELHTRGFVSFGVREVYINEDGSEVYSDILYAPGYEDQTATSVSNISSDKTISSISFIDLNGRVSARPGNGIYVKQTIYSDGTISTQKVIRK